MSSFDINVVGKNLQVFKGTYKFLDDFISQAELLHDMVKDEEKELFVKYVYNFKLSSQYPDFKKPFRLTTDASNYALGAVLSQGCIGSDLPISYAKIRNELLFNEQLIKLKFLENKVEQIIENIYSAKHNIFHPSILTSEEIDKFNIDFYKLSLIKMGNCNLIFNNNTSFELFDDETIIIKNARNMKINNSCNQNTSNILNGNNILMFSNCKITIQNENFSNLKENYFEKIPDYNTYSNKEFTTKITFNDIVLSNTKNIEKIEELKQHQHISYSLIVVMFVVTVTGMTVIIYIFKGKSVNIKINETIQENPLTRGGGVTYPYPTDPYATANINHIMMKYEISNINNASKHSEN
ncbi:uncharacterized protein [Musca autumnalis]|uniref:uncharacterized protein n=1 Tax=Musca autumnalis TaxID=221902 RepID=UPI003CF21D61